MSDITRRKDEHIEIVLNRDVSNSRTTTGLERVVFEHVAVPELGFDEIDVSTSFLGRSVSAPILISSMTGGAAKAEDINLAIAEAANALGIGFGVGSQRVALETGNLAGFGHNLRQRAGAVPILANLGAAQLRFSDAGDLARRAVDMIEADGLIVHLNPLQEAVQSGGDTDWRGVLAAIESLARDLETPIIVKEVGNGISGRIARRLVDAGVAAVDVAGAGGTSWAAVEAERAESEHDRKVAAAFRDWGVPTAQAIAEVRRACPQTPVIASGGIANGIDAAKAIRLGADLAAQAAGVLAAAVEGPERLIETLSATITQLKVACFCTGSRDLGALRNARLCASEPEWQT